MTDHLSPTELLSTDVVDDLKALAALIREDRVGLLVGSGLSKRRGMPHWEKLVSNLVKAWQLREPVRSLRILSPTNYEAVVRQHFDQNVGAIPSFLRRRLEDHYTEEELLFGHIVFSALYAHPRLGKTELTPEPDDVHRHLICLFDKYPSRIWTTNYDDLLELAADQCGVSFETLHLEDRQAASSLEIAHIHGFMPPRARRVDPECAGEESFILAEDDYHATTADPAGWPNRELHRLLDEHHALILGMSLSDPNVRRVLSILREKHHRVGASSRDRVSHFAVLRSKGGSELDVKYIGEERRDGVARETMETQREFWANYGVRLIHIPDHDSILPLIVRLRYESEGESPGDLWRMASEVGYEAVDPWHKDRQDLAQTWLTAAIEDLLENYRIPTGEIVELGIFLLKPNSNDLELVFRSGAGVSAVPGGVLFSADPDRPSGVAGRVFVSGEVARIPTRHPLYDFNVEERESTSGTEFEGIVSAPIVDWQRGGVPIGVVYMTTSTTGGVVFALDREFEAKPEDKTIHDLYRDLNRTAMRLLNGFRRRVPLARSSGSKWWYPLPQMGHIG